MLWALSAHPLYHPTPGAEGAAAAPRGKAPLGCPVPQCLGTFRSPSEGWNRPVPRSTRAARLRGDPSSSSCVTLTPIWGAGWCGYRNLTEKSNWHSRFCELAASAPPKKQTGIPVLCITELETEGCSVPHHGETINANKQNNPSAQHRGKRCCLPP